jgi:hypothetical protein
LKEGITGAYGGPSFPLVKACAAEQILLEAGTIAMGGVGLCMKKTFRLRADQIQSLAYGYGACIATDMITVEGRRVGFMYRENADDAVDSGWRFLSGHESQEYLDDVENHAVYDINTIANYDPEIIPFLQSATGSAFERDPTSGRFRAAEFPADEDG